MGILNTVSYVANHPLNRQRKLGALAELFRFWAGSRLVTGAVAYPWINGTKVLVRPGEQGLNGNVYCGLHEFADMAYLLHVTAADDLFVDVGANVGSYTVLACGARGARGICVEPIPSTYERLLDNLRLNDLMGRVAAHNVGLSDQDGELLFSTRENCMNHILAEGESERDAVRVPVVRLDSLVGDQQPSLLKIDVEGYELPVLRGGTDTLGRSSLHSLIVELNGSNSRYGFGDGELIGLVQDFGFQRHVYEPFTRGLTRATGSEPEGGNALFVRDAAAVRDRLRRAAPFEVCGRRL